MKINVPKMIASDRKKVFCPLCNYDGREIVMAWDGTLKTYKCNYCNYIVPKQQDAVEKGSLVAGNEELYTRPYARSVSIHKKVKPIVQEVYNNPLDAWKNDEIL